MIHTLLDGFKYCALLFVLVSCGYTKKTAEINNSVIPLYGKKYYRLPEAKFQALYLGDYDFKYFSRMHCRRMLQKWNMPLNTNDSIFFVAHTTIPPYYQSTIIKIDTSQSSLINFIHPMGLKKEKKFIYSNRFKNYVLLFWGSKNIPTDFNIPYNNDSLEFTVIKNSMTENLNSFVSDFYSLSTTSFFDSSLNMVNYLAPLIQLEYFTQKNLTASEKNILKQLLSTYHSFVGNIDSVELLNKPKWKLKSISDSLKERMKPASEIILQLAKQTDLLLINEAHYYPQTRMTLLNSLNDLYKEGYRVLACEAVNVGDTLINKRGYPIISTGFYTNEPTFSTLLTYALSLGFKVYGYDQSVECNDCDVKDRYCCANKRDLVQAKIIKK